MSVNHKSVCFIIFLFGCALSILSQDKIKIQFSQKKIERFTEMIIPLNNGFVYEKYNFFKHHYFLMIRDTMSSVNDSIFEGKRVIINQNSYQQIDFCDSVVNYTRNYWLENNYRQMIDDSCLKYIGTNRDIFKGSTRVFKKLMCSSIFALTADSNFREFNKRILEIEKMQQLRSTQVKNNPKSITKQFVNDFLLNYTSSKSNNEVFLEICVVNPKELLICLYRLEETNWILHKIVNLPNNARLLEAISSIEGTGFSNKIQRQVLKILKRSST